MTVTQKSKRQAVVLFWSDMAIHYYVSARAAVFWNHHPHAELQAHHAIEMALKWALARPLRQPWKTYRALNGRARTRAVAELREARHSLTKLWAMLDQDYPKHRLGYFRDYVAFLNRVEVMRYQEFPESGEPVGYAPTMEDAKRVTGGETYSVDLPKLDELFRGLLDLVETDPNWLKGAVDPGWMNRGSAPAGSAQDYYLRENPHALWPR